VSFHCGEEKRVVDGVERCDSLEVRVVLLTIRSVADVQADNEIYVSVKES
jgi:hypothetical protein